jgi:hypothetical protein
VDGPRWPKREVPLVLALLAMPTVQVRLECGFSYDECGSDDIMTLEQTARRCRSCRFRAGPALVIPGQRFASR